MQLKHFLIGLLTAVLVMLGVAIAPQSSSGQSTGVFEFALIGDLPYNDTQVQQFGNLIDNIDRSNAVFVVHDGDLKSGGSLCSDEMFLNRRELFNRFQTPFIFVPGDNDWTDCHRESNGPFDPIERLAKIRELFASGNQSLGQQTLTLERQSEDFPENVRWVYGNVMFVGLHIVGSNNNLGRTPQMDVEYQRRNAANLAWLREAFDVAERDDNFGVMIFIQANPNFERSPEERTGFNDFIAQLEEEAPAFQKPVVLVHGDSHYFRIDKPIPTWLPDEDKPHRLANFTRVETFGDPDVHWLRAIANPNDPNLFEFVQQIIPENVM